MITLSVAAIVRNGDRILLVKRGRDPYAGHWGLPGGKVRALEPYADAIVREVREETGLMVRPLRIAGVAEAIDAGAGSHYVILVSFVSVAGGELQAGDDAAEAAWFRRDQLAGMALTPRLAPYLDEFAAFG